MNDNEGDELNVGRSCYWRGAVLLLFTSRTSKDQNKSILQLQSTHCEVLYLRVTWEQSIKNLLSGKEFAKFFTLWVTKLQQF